MGPLQAIERKKAKGKGTGRGKGRLLLGRGRGKGKGKGGRKGRGRVAQSENSAVRRRLSFSDDGDQAPAMGSQQVHPSDGGPATPETDKDDAMDVHPSSPHVEPAPFSADVEMQFGDAAAAAGDDVSPSDVVSRGQMGSLDLCTADGEASEDPPSAAGHNDMPQAPHPDLVPSHLSQQAAPEPEPAAPEPEPAAPSEAPDPAEAERSSGARGPTIHRSPDELHLITPPSCSIHLNCNLASLLTLHIQN